MVRRPTRAVWLAVAGLASSAIAGYATSRTTGLPNATGDIGNWTEPLGLASLFVEGSLVAIASAALALLPAPKRLGSPLGVSIGASA